MLGSRAVQTEIFSSISMECLFVLHRVQLGDLHDPQAAAIAVAAACLSKQLPALGSALAAPGGKLLLQSCSLPPTVTLVPGLCHSLGAAAAALLPHSVALPLQSTLYKVDYNCQNI